MTGWAKDGFPYTVEYQTPLTLPPVGHFFSVVEVEDWLNELPTLLLFYIRNGFEHFLWRPRNQTYTIFKELHSYTYIRDVTINSDGWSKRIVRFLIFFFCKLITLGKLLGILDRSHRFVYGNGKTSIMLVPISMFVSTYKMIKRWPTGWKFLYILCRNVPWSVF